MVKKPEIQYIDKFYVHGSEARVLELKPKRRIIKTILPLSAPDNTIKIAVDPVALCGILVAAAMLVLLVVGTVQYVHVCSQYQDMMDYVVAVQNRNVELNQKYEDGYDLAQIEEKDARYRSAAPRSKGDKSVDMRDLDAMFNDI